VLPHNRDHNVITGDCGVTIPYALPVSNEPYLYFTRQPPSVTATAHRSGQVVGVNVA